MTRHGNPSEASDADLLDASRGGDRPAFAHLFDRHRPMLAILAHRMLGDHVLVEDAVQEAAVIALTSLDNLREPDRFGAWLAGIVLNICRQWLRQRSRREWSLETMQGACAGPAIWTGGSIQRRRPPKQTSPTGFGPRLQTSHPASVGRLSSSTSGACGTRRWRTHSVSRWAP